MDHTIKIQNGLVMTLQNPPKAIIVLVALICLTFLLAIERIDTTAAVGMISLIVGYGIGNGVAAKHGDPVDPIIGTTRRDRRADDA